MRGTMQGRHPAVRANLQEIRIMRVIIGVHDNRHVVPCLLVMLNEAGDVEIDQLIRKKQDEALVEQRQGIDQRASGTPRFLLDLPGEIRLCPDPVPRPADDLVGAIPEQQQHALQAILRREFHLSLEHCLPGHRHERFGQSTGQRCEPGAKSASKNNQLRRCFDDSAHRAAASSSTAREIASVDDIVGRQPRPSILPVSY